MASDKSDMALSHGFKCDGDQGPSGGIAVPEAHGGERPDRGVDLSSFHPTLATAPCVAISSVISSPYEQREDPCPATTSASRAIDPTRRAAGRVSQSTRGGIVGRRDRLQARQQLKRPGAAGTAPDMARKR